MRIAFWLLTTLACPGQWTIDRMVTESGDRTTYHSRPVDPVLTPRWPDDLEREFQARAHRVIQAIAASTRPNVNTYFENEKRDYGFLMAHVLGGRREEALLKLQATDHQHEVWHRETMGIDYYACFTLKHQMRKYFHFGDLLDPAYKSHMFEGARRWTERDPLLRPHYAFTGPGPGWGPDVKNSWVDVRSTENLYLMRVTSVYLMAEETGNRDTAKKYKDHLLRYTASLYRVGIGEWDSENYHGHSVAPLLNLHDFAKDPVVRRAAKACLDFYAAAGAVKYYRGGFNGPTKRDYNHAQPFGGSAANALWLWFGDHPTGKTEHWESDEVHQITSSYRPPLAVVHLARRNFKKPCELFAAKPSYTATTQGQLNARPEYLETQYFGHHYQMGSLTHGTSTDGGDVNGFKILALDNANGAIALQAAPTKAPLFVGSPQYQTGVIAAPNRVAQLNNLALWLAKDGGAPWLWVLPDSVAVSHRDGVTFLKADRTWVAIRGIRTSLFHSDPDLTRSLLEDKQSRFRGHQVVSAQGTGGGFSGMAIEVGEAESHGTFGKFQAAAIAAELDLSDLDTGAARYRSADGNHLGIHWNDNPLDLGVWRNGKRRDLRNPGLYESEVIRSAWGSGILEVTAGGHAFRCEVTENGLVK